MYDTIVGYCSAVAGGWVVVWEARWVLPAWFVPAVLSAVDVDIASVVCPLGPLLILSIGLIYKLFTEKDDAFGVVVGRTAAEFAMLPMMLFATFVPPLTIFSVLYALAKLIDI